jgi:hypothetical protein
MAKFKRLRDLYRFPGFAARSQVHGLFGDPLAVVITLQRRRKKRPAASAVAPITDTTTSGLGMCAISPVATGVFTCTFFYAVSNVLSVAA